MGDGYKSCFNLFLKFVFRLLKFELYCVFVINKVKFEEYFDKDSFIG